MTADERIKVDVPDDLKPAERVVIDTIERFGHATRMYPDVYACHVVLALRERGLL